MYLYDILFIFDVRSYEQSCHSIMVVSGTLGLINQSVKPFLSRKLEDGLSEGRAEDRAGSTLSLCFRVTQD